MPLISVQLVVPTFVNYSWTVKQIYGVITNPCHVYRRYPPTGEDVKTIDLRLIRFNFRKWQRPDRIVRLLDGINMRPADGSEFMGFLRTRPNMICGFFTALGARYFLENTTSDNTDISGWLSPMVDLDYFSPDYHDDLYGKQVRNRPEIREFFWDEIALRPDMIYLAVEK